MKATKGVKAIGFGVAAVALAGWHLPSPAVAGPTGLAMLDRVQPGLWKISEYGAEGKQQDMCIRHGRQLIQLQHPGEACSSFIIEDTASAVTVQYTCRGTGYGRTRIRLERPVLAQIEAQGVQRGLPFDLRTEARRLGPCAN